MNSVNVENAIQAERKRIEEAIEEYFKGLVVIPNPQLTKVNILAIIHNNKDV